MSNQFRKKIEEHEEELQQEELVEATEQTTTKQNENSFLKKLFVDGVVSKDAATDMLPFIIFLCVLGMVYIANSHMAMKSIRRIDKLSKEVKALNWEYKALKADLMFKSKLTAVADKVDTLGLKVLIEPPKKIIVNNGN